MLEMLLDKFWMNSLTYELIKHERIKSKSQEFYVVQEMWVQIYSMHRLP